MHFVLEKGKGMEWRMLMSGKKYQNFKSFAKLTP